MSKSAHPLDNININEACDADWDSMLGGDAVRFCSHCSLNVTDLSLLTRHEALKLVRRSNGRLCLRYVRRPDGTINTAPPHQKLHLIKRRASRIAAGAFGATLGLTAATSAYARPADTQAGPVADVSREAALKAGFVTHDGGGSAELVGTVLDPQGATVPGATVTLINVAEQLRLTTTSSDVGEYRFSSLPGGAFTLIVNSPGFSHYQIDDMVLSDFGEQRRDVVLEISNVTATTGMVVVVLEPSEPLVKAVLDGDVGALKRLLALGAQVNVLDKNLNTTPLIEAVEKGYGEIVRVLLKAGADPNQINSLGRTALMYMTEETTVEIVKDLLAAGANLEAVDKDKDSALMWAAQIDKVELVRALLKEGARVNECNEDGQTALMLAARDGHIENVKALIEALADVNKRDDDECTALVYAIKNDRVDVAKLLKSYGAVE